jgi:hypothetical protein
MSRQTTRFQHQRNITLTPLIQRCPFCREQRPIQYLNFRRVQSLDSKLRLRLRIGQCKTPNCPRHLKPYRPEPELLIAPPRLRFGFDLLAALRHEFPTNHPNVAELSRSLPLPISRRSIPGLITRLNRLDVDLPTIAESISRISHADGGVILLFGQCHFQTSLGRHSIFLICECLTSTPIAALSLEPAQAAATVAALSSFLSHRCRILATLSPPNLEIEPRRFFPAAPHYQFTSPAVVQR